MRIKGGLPLAFSASGNAGRDQFAISSTASNAPPTQRKYRATGIHSSAPPICTNFCYFTPPSPAAVASTQDGRDAWRRFNSRRISSADRLRHDPILYLAWLLLLIQIKADEATRSLSPQTRANVASQEGCE